MRIKVLFIFLFSFSAVVAQRTEDQKNLERRKQELNREIQNINALLLKEQKQEGSVLQELRALGQQSTAIRRVIQITNQQIQILEEQIENNESQAIELKETLKVLKEDYALMIRKSYQKNLEKNRLMFLLSAKSFKEAYKRWDYMIQYADFRKSQGEKIEQSQVELERVNQELLGQLKEKQALLDENNNARANLLSQRKRQESILTTIRKNETKYQKEIDTKVAEQQRIDQEIRSLIELEIKKSSSSRSSSAFELTPEAKIIAGNFAANKGNHIWPVEKGVKSEGFGQYTDKLYPGLKLNNNGVTIATEQGAVARSIYEGQVMTIMTNKQGIKGVYVRHGDYITMYYNLESVYVKEGQKIEAKTALGNVHTDKIENVTKLKFYVYKNKERLNPESWVNKL
ncbi:MAG: peptidase M23 [Flavobacteriaceae bacterium]|nr:peptidase M23 [Flavobacteriaceae bacterium]